MTQERPLPPARPWYELVVREIALKGWTKSELSYRSGVARTTIDNWNTNRRKPSAKAVNAVADTLKFDRAKAHVLAGIVAPADGETRGPVPQIPQDILDAIVLAYPGDENAATRERLIDGFRRVLEGESVQPQPARRRRAV